MYRLPGGVGVAGVSGHARRHLAKSRLAVVHSLIWKQRWHFLTRASNLGKLQSYPHAWNETFGWFGESDGCFNFLGISLARPAITWKQGI